MNDRAHTHKHTHKHSHDHALGHGSNEVYKNKAFRRLEWSLGITTLVMVVEVIGGWLSGSLALISDAGHMLTHTFAIAVSMFGIYIARKPACHHRTFGLLRAEVLAALVNGLFLVAVSVWIGIESIQRFLAPREILTAQMFLVAILGLAANIISVFLLEGSRKKDLNIQSVFLHMIGDAASSVAIVAAAVVIQYTRWFWLDPAVSLVIAALIAIWAYGLLKESARALLEMAPKGMDVRQIGNGLQERFPAVRAISREHLWTITAETIVFSAHLRVDPAAVAEGDFDAWLREVERWLSETYGIAESTLQVHPVSGTAGPTPGGA